MAARLGSAGVNEGLLFHGTSFSNLERILRENFRLDKTGSDNGMDWGKGFYLSESCHMSRVRPACDDTHVVRLHIAVDNISKCVE